MSRYRLTPGARSDLSSIWDFTEERWDLGQAETYLSEIRAALERIAAEPSRGRRCDEVRDGYRRYGIGSHLIYYRERDHGVDVIRILHQRMDPSRHL
ncbi:type II toxin-antitoxin system RelE/ParE family toxin [Tsukamurella spumae]|uniref:Toxin n=1 Tax=Tsukamurella spumae TaxID=44753 RepID=A0A846WW48_9ACTN|nr:type II toxin-antitoxin system RelE/ParE family toxin [Tsukamurella spumae]NKY17084.1 type II toxin-antitoxin system RelE/ParE family toxin [Tsukamurella spumae]